MTFIASDTVHTEMAAYVSRCPTGEGWLLEGIDSVVTVLIWLPADTTATWIPVNADRGDQPRAVFQRLARSAIDTWLADSGEIDLRRGRLGYRGRFTVYRGYQRAHGTFRTGRPVADTTACAASTPREH